jgi:hypothetical protein
MEIEATARPFEFRGDGGTPIRYEDIVLYRDIVFLVWDRPYSEEERSAGAPAIGTSNYTGYICEKSGTSFTLTYFSNLVTDGHLSAIEGTRILGDGGVAAQPMTYDESSMKFWKVGELHASKRAEQA